MTEHENSPPRSPVSPPWSTTLKVVVGVLVIVLVGLAAYAFRAVFAPVIVGAIIAYVLSPAVRRITRALPLPHGLATLLVFLLVLAIIIPLGIIGVQEVLQEITLLDDILIDTLRQLQASSADTFSILGFNIIVGELVDAVVTGLIGMIRTAVPNTVGFALNAARSVVIGIFTLFIGFYLTRDSNRIVAAIKSLAPPEYRTDFTLLLSEIDRVWAAFLRGQLILSLTVTVILTVISAVLGLPQPLLLGVWGGLLEFLPSIGNMIWGATAVLVAIFAGSSTLAVPPFIFVLIVLGVYMAFAQIDVNILIPNILGGQVRLHPVVVLLGVIIGLTLGGVLGVALAAPMIASLRVIGQYIYAKLFDLNPFPFINPPTPPEPAAEAVPGALPDQPPA